MPRDEFGREAHLWVFQITTVLTHSVSGRGVAFVLDRLGFITKANEQPQRVALVFVVPSDVAEQFERQEIEVKISSEEGDLCNVNGIDDTQEKALKAAGIYTVRDLRNVLEGWRRWGPTHYLSSWIRLNFSANYSISMTRHSNNESG